MKNHNYIKIVWQPNLNNSLIFKKNNIDYFTITFNKINQWQFISIGKISYYKAVKSQFKCHFDPDASGRNLRVCK